MCCSCDEVVPLVELRQLRFAPGARMPYTCYGEYGNTKNFYFMDLTIVWVMFALAVIQAIMSFCGQPTVWMSSSTQIIAEAL